MSKENKKISDDANKKNKKSIKEKKEEKKKLNIKNVLGNIIKSIKKININFGLVAIILIAIYCICITPITFQNDTYYTIKIGEYIKNNGIDMMDHFSWHQDLPYTYPHWLYDLLTYIIYSFAGFKGIYIATAILSIILGISIFIVNSKLTKSKVIPFIVTICSLYILRNYITARAQLVTFILFIWELFFIEKFIEKKKILYAVGLVIISLLIANLHSAVWPFFFVLFLPYVAEYLFCILSDAVIYRKVTNSVYRDEIKKAIKENKLEKAERLQVKYDKFKERISKIKIKREQSNKKPYKIVITNNKNVKFLIIIMIVCALMGLITPIKDTPYTYLYKTMQGNTTDNISEHIPMTIVKSDEVMCIIVILLAIMIFTKTKIKMSDLFMLTGLLYLMLSSRRQLSMLTLIGSVILSKLIIDLIRRYTKNGIEEVERAFKYIIIIIPLTIMMIIVSYNSIKTKLDDKFVDSKSYPVEACDYILENIDLENAKIYNEYNFGSYMLFKDIPVFIDSRADLYTPEFNKDKEKDIFTDFINTSSISNFYEDTFEKYGITHLLISKKSKTNMVITKTNNTVNNVRYVELYSDDNFVLYMRLVINLEESMNFVEEM